MQQVQAHIEACQYNQALEKIWRQILDPANQYADTHASRGSWSRPTRTAAKHVLYDLVEQLRCAAILLKPFLPRTAETIYRSFNFPQPWEEVRYEDVWVHPRPGGRPARAGAAGGRQGEAAVSADQLGKVASMGLLTLVALARTRATFGASVNRPNSLPPNSFHRQNLYSRQLAHSHPPSQGHTVSFVLKCTQPQAFISNQEHTPVCTLIWHCL